MPRLCHAILYDADDKGRETLAYGFEVDGLKITAAKRVDEFERALTSAAAEAVVVVLRDDDDRAIPLLRALAENPQHAQLPRLVLADAATLPESVAQMNLPGPRGFLPLPAFVRDVVTAAKLLAGGAARAEETSLEGALSDFGLFFILRTMVALGLSGIVEVERSTRKGELRFHEGEVVSAQVGPHEGTAALHQLLLWEEAALVIRFKGTVRRGQEFPKGEELLDDCARFLRDFEHATRLIGHAQSLFVQDAEKTASLLESVTAELVPVLRLFDGHRNLGDVLEDSPYRAFDTLRTVARLIELKTIRRKALEKPTTGFSPGRRARPAQEDWLGRGPESAGAGATSPGAGDVDRASLPRPARVEPAAAGGGPPGSRGHRSFRRKTGEHAIAPAPAPGAPPPAVAVRTSSIPTQPLPAVIEPAPPAPAAPVPAAVVAPATAPVAPSPASVAPPARRIDPTAVAQIHGELRGGSSEQLVRQVVADVPTMLIDLGPELLDPDLVSDDDEQIPVAAAPAPIPVAPEGPSPPPAADAAPAFASSPPIEAAPPSPAASPVLPTESSMPADLTPSAPPPHTEPPPPRRPDVHAAEIDTGLRPRPPGELLEAPSGGPSIMIDPRLVAEMDAFELENASPTPPPQLTGAAPAAAPRSSSTPPPAGVVSFVRGLTGGKPGAAGPAFNAAPTIQVAPVPSPPAAAPEPPPAAPVAPTPPPTAVAGELAAGRHTPTGRAAVGHERRASCEFDALESEFFAREKDLYGKEEPVENFDDLDHKKKP